MPLFFGNKRKDAPVSAAIRGPFGLENLKGNKSTTALNERPQTSYSVADTSKRRRDGGPRLPFVSKRSSTNTKQPALSLVTRENQANGCDDYSIGIAIGSPSDSRPPVALDSAVKSTAIIHPQNSSQTQGESATRIEGSEEADGADAAIVRRWRTVSGLFARKKAAVSVVALTPPEESIEESAVARPRPQTSKSDETRRRSISFKRAPKSQAPSVPAIDNKYKGSSHPHLPTPTPGEARAYEADDPSKGPSLDIDIPDSGMDRYSVMFSNCLESTNVDNARPRQSLLARRTGVESLSIQSPCLTAKRSISTLNEAETSTSPERTQQAQTAALPIRTYSLAPFGPQYRRSAIPAPLFSEKHQQLKHSRSAIGILSSDAAPTSPDDPFAISEAHPHPAYPLTPRLAFSVPETPPESPVAIDGESYISYSRPESTVSTASSPTSPPSPTSSHGSPAQGYFLAQAAKFMRGPELTTIPSQRSSASSHRTTTSTAPDLDDPTPDAQTHDSTSFLMPPSSSPSLPHTPWDLSKAFPSPLYPSPSPRMKFGYDCPHSPLIAIAKAVTVCVKTGQGCGQRPQFVVHEGMERGLGTSATFVREE